MSAPRRLLAFAVVLLAVFALSFSAARVLTGPPATPAPMEHTG